MKANKCVWNRNVRKGGHFYGEKKGGGKNVDKINLALGR